MGIYYTELLVKVIFNEEIITEEFFKGIISNLKIAIRVRDFREGRAGQNTKHKDSPSIKVISYGPGKNSKHSAEGDPIYFWKDSNGNIQLNYENIKSFDSKEKKYIENFINHNYINLTNYWFAPKNISNSIELEKYQNDIKLRILNNISNIDYRKEQEKIDDEVTI